MSAVVLSDKGPRSQNAGSVLRRQLADQLNRLNFLEEPVLVQFLHRKYGQTQIVEADPLPCDGEDAAGRWRSPLPENISQYKIDKVVLPGNPRAFAFEVDDPRFTADGFRCVLPRKGQKLPQRQFSRMRPLAGIKATVSQYGVCFSGKLTDFSAYALSVEVPRPTPNSRYWITTGQEIHLSLQSGPEVVFSGEMRVLRVGQGPDVLLFVLEPVRINTPRYPGKHHRAFRTRLLPEPSLSFRHPLTGRYLELGLIDLSVLGGCVEETSDRSMLLAGMVIPEMHIKLGTGFEIPCKGQVVYRNEQTDGPSARCGISLLDMGTRDHLWLFSILQRARDRHLYLSPEVDIESLWEFFFETGFIYPTKYLQLAQRKKEFLETFRKTYQDQTPIARHFTFQADGLIQAHISAVRLFEQTWFQQHHAARRIGKQAVGFEVIEQLAEYFYNACFLSRDKIGYVAGFYRPENRFPSKYYRSIVAHLKNPKAASLDSFAYFKTVPDVEDQKDWVRVPSMWQVVRTTRGDLDELHGFYEQVSGGCMIDALDLRPKMLGRDLLSEEYKKLGMLRRRHLFSIKRENELMGIVDLHESDTGLSLSRMDRAIIAYILDDDLPPGLLTALVKGLAGKLHLDNPPMMTFPRTYAENHGLEGDKIYEMMVLNVQHGEEYMQFLDTFIGKHSSVR